LNPDYRGKLEAAGMKVSGVSADGGARIIELPDHHFFIGTGFVPQLSSEENKPHPLVVAYLKAALGRIEKVTIILPPLPTTPTNLNNQSIVLHFPAAGAP
jgi:CTP synthase (UTP-ammonia lyase)